MKKLLHYTNGEKIHDIVGITSKSVKAYLNNKEIIIRGFKGNMNMYLDLTDRKEEEDIYCENCRCQIEFGLSEGKFAQVSFVNGICTTRGETHFTYLVDQVAKYLHDIIFTNEQN